MPCHRVFLLEDRKRHLGSPTCEHLGDCDTENACAHDAHIETGLGGGHFD